jgi:CRISPR-associated protein Cst2
MQNIKSILVSTLVPMSNHIANGGEKLLGNAGSIKKRPDGRVYISGQMQRHALFSAIERLNWEDDERGKTYVSNGDGISNKIEVDLRADMGGFMHPSKGNYSGRRESPISVTPAVAIEKSEIGRDLLVRLRRNEESMRDQALATNEFSQSDLMLMNFSLDVTTLGTSKKFEYDNEYHINTDFIKHVSEDERKRRVKLFLKATQSLTDYANQARNAIAGEPQQVLIVFDTKLSRKAARYFEAEGKEQHNIEAELKQRDAQIFHGNDIDGETSVNEAYNKAFDLFSSSSLFDPAGGDENIQTFAEVFEN